MQRRRSRRANRLREVLVLIGLLVVLTLVGRLWLEDEPSTVAGVARLIDGDSLTIGDYEVRLLGIDAPEGRQTCLRAGKSWPCGEDARRHLKSLIAGRQLQCSVVTRDRHGRLLSRCRAGDLDLNSEMVQSGFAVAFGDYDTEEREARSAGRGLWSGTFDRPKDWREQHLGRD